MSICVKQQLCLLLLSLISQMTNLMNLDFTTPTLNGLYIYVDVKNSGTFGKCHELEMAIINPEIKLTQIYIENEWHDSVSGKTFPTLNPSNGKVIAYVQEGDKDDVDRAVAAARRAFETGWRKVDGAARGKLLLKVADLVVKDRNYLASLETLENGKTFSAACWSVDIAVDYLHYYAGFADKTYGKTVPVDGDYFSFTFVEPIGVVGQILPWNFPFMLTVVNIAPAIAAGCCLVVKPAEQTPLATLYLASLFGQVGFPPGVFNVVPGYGPTAGAALAQHMDVDMISFTGSLEVGKLIQQASATSNLKRVALELGGKNPLVISQHCNLDEAVEIAQLACFFNHGQVCCAGSRIFVHSSIYDEFVERSVEAALKRKLGDPFALDTVQGPQIDHDQMTRILQLIDSGRKEGATLRCGGHRHGDSGYFVEPTIFTDVADDMRIAREEIFGPVMQIFKYDSLDEAIDRSNDTDYGLAAGILTKNVDEAIRFSSGVRAGTVWVNNYYNGNWMKLPFGGYKQSGIGRTGGEEGIMEYLEVKTVTITFASTAALVSTAVKGGGQPAEGTRPQNRSQKPRRGGGVWFIKNCITNRYRSSHLC